jgi:hypothetical protein
MIEILRRVNLSIIVVRKTEKEKVNFHVSRLIEAIWLQPNGSAKVTIEGMITADRETEPFDSLEIIFPDEIQQVRDVTESFFDINLFENTARQAGYKVINASQGKVELSGIQCEVSYPLEITSLRSNGYCIVSIIFPKLIQPNEVRVFRIMLELQKLANKKTSYYHGTITYDFLISFYDIIRLNSSALRKQLESHKERIIRCERVHLWVILPENIEIISISPLPNHVIEHNRKDPLSKEKDKERKALGWEPLSLTAAPWTSLRLNGTVKKQTLLSITTALAILGFITGLLSLIISILR